MSSKYVSVSISERTSVGVSRFHGSVWYHIKNRKKDKSVSLSKELKILFSKKDKLMQAALKVSRAKKRSREEESNSEDSDATLCFESDD